MISVLDGYGFHVREQGEEKGLPLIFLHGFPFSSAMWSPQFEALPPEYRAIAYDLRGLGANDPGDGQYTVEGHVDDLLALMDHWKIPRAVLIGLSMGGYIALRALEREGDRFLAAVLADTRSETDSDPARWRRANQVKQVKAIGSLAFADVLLSSGFAPESFKTKPESVALIRKIIAHTKPLAIAGTLIALAARSDTTSALDKFKLPVLILVGEKDAITPVSAAQSMQRRIAGSRLEIIPEAAHLSNLENPADFNRHLLEFLRSVPRP
ncbi:MAG TPA: alpha/beta hydrolase [bacterium]|nr:alpha/beta hydrolase [bacterium]